VASCELRGFFDTVRFSERERESERERDREGSITSFVRERFARDESSVRERSAREICERGL
jgi:hypothetical protein